MVPKTITSREIRNRWGDSETIAMKVMRRRLEWLGHVARMPDHCIPKQLLLGWLPQPHPCGGPEEDGGTSYEKT